MLGIALLLIAHFCPVLFFPFGVLGAGLVALATLIGLIVAIIAGAGTLVLGTLGLVCVIVASVASRCWFPFC